MLEKFWIFVLGFMIAWLLLFIKPLAKAFIPFQELQSEQDEQIKILEQSLNEQIQEKEVYMRMLEDEYE